jgi:Regulator of ribonuclease activity B
VSQPDFPDDDNGDVLRRMTADGDDLSEPRNIDFEHVFESKEDALAFIDVVSEKERRVTLSWYEDEQAWNVCVSQFMLPTHAAITSIELSLGQQAERHGGRSDGWGCFQVDLQGDS